MTDASSRSSNRLLEILTAKIAAETGAGPDLARELATSALTSPSVDEDEPIVLFDNGGREVARIQFALVEEAFDELDDEEDGKG
ncbi:MAG: hypothetical protein IPN03_21660 [Holophagales bacterium]|nr:hypothetical protein [Holophagales bacterium]